MNRTIYIKTDIWNLAKFNANINKISISAYITSLITNDVNINRRKRIISIIKS